MRSVSLCLLVALVGYGAASPVPQENAQDTSVNAFLTSLVAVDNRTDSLVKIAYQNMASKTHFDHDNAPNPLFTSVDPFVDARPTFKALANLLNFYTQPSILQPLTYTAPWTQAIQDFLSAVVDTPVMKKTQDFLVSKGTPVSARQDFINQLYSLWFTPFQRTSVLGSSGFSSVFAGEVQNTNVIRFANWYRFHLLEKQDVANYHGFFTKQNGVQIAVQFLWNTWQAVDTAFLLNTTPEFEMAIYTVCALNGGDCSFTAQGFGVDITATLFTGASTQVIDQVVPVNGGGSGPATTKKPSGGTTKKGGSSSDPQLQTLVDQMRAADVDKPAASDYTLDWGNKVSGTKDTSPNPLFKQVNEAVFQRPVYQVLIDVFDQGLFTPDVCTAEPGMTGFRKTTLQNVLNTWAGTQVFQLAYQYLNGKGNAHAKDIDTLKNYLFNFWFGTYSRCKGPMGSSGWEHVFSGEWKSGTIDGQHDWTRYYLLEKADKINYHGYYSYDGQLTGTFQYTWQNELKQTGGFLFGTSPAFDFCLLTVCAMEHSGANACQFKLDGYQLAVTSYTQACDAGTCLSTAYPTN